MILGSVLKNPIPNDSAMVDQQSTAWKLKTAQLNPAKLNTSWTRNNRTNYRVNGQKTNDLLESVVTISENMENNLKLNYILGKENNNMVRQQNYQINKT